MWSWLERLKLSTVSPGQNVHVPSNSRTAANGAVPADVIAALVLALGTGYLYWRTMPPCCTRRRPGPVAVRLPSTGRFLSHRLSKSYDLGQTVDAIGSLWRDGLPDQPAIGGIGCAQHGFVVSVFAQSCGRPLSGSAGCNVVFHLAYNLVVVYYH